MGLVFCLSQIIARPPYNDILAVQNEIVQNLFQIQNFRPTINHRQKNDTKTILQAGMFIELIDNHPGDLIFF